MEAKNYSLESNVSVWSDFLRLHFHPRSLLLLPEYHHREYVCSTVNLLTTQHKEYSNLYNMYANHYGDHRSTRNVV